MVLILANAFFVAAEFALVAADRSRIDQEAEAGDKRATTVQGLFRRLSFHLSGAQLGITVSSLVLGFVAEPTLSGVLAPVFDRIPEGARPTVSALLALAIATVAQMVLGELVPKSLAIVAPERTSMRLARVVRVYGVVFGPVIRVLNGAANATVRRLGMEPREELSHVRTLPELALVIQASAQEGTLAGNASTLLTRSIRFGEKRVADVLVPRTDVSALASDATVADLIELAERTGFSRFPVYGADLDDIVGVVHVKSVYRLPPDERGSTPVAALATEVVVVPETRELDDVLVDMRARANVLAVAVDEYGGTAGIVTVEDIVEEIVGEIDDEYDTIAPSEHVIELIDGYRVPGALHLDQVREGTGFDIPEGPYETIAGFVLERLGHVPEPGERVEHGGWVLEVVAMERRRVASVRLRRPVEQADADGDGGPG